jgi:translation elongation factor EF-Tu-like GTPase
VGGIQGVRAKLYLLRTEEGGRRSGVSTGYRPGVFFGPTEDEGYDGHLVIEGHDTMGPGEEYAVRIEFLRPDLIPSFVGPNTPFRVQEGGWVVGRGTVLEVIKGPAPWQRPVDDAERASVRSARP